MNYLEVSQAVDRPGLRLVLTAGVPGPWGEAAKGIFGVKKIPYLAVRQLGGLPNPELEAWTGRDNAPIAVYDDEPPLDRWDEILALAERIEPEPRLIPVDPAERARMFDLAGTICGEGGFGWQRRLMLLHPMLSRDEPLPEQATAVARGLGDKYGYTQQTGAAAPARVREILLHLSRTLAEQRAAGSPYFIGSQLSALDIYWATFAAMIEPLPEALCAMPVMLRAVYGLRNPAVREAADPILLEHRDFVYQQHLKLPLDF